MRNVIHWIEFCAGPGLDAADVEGHDRFLVEMSSYFFESINNGNPKYAVIADNLLVFLKSVPQFFFFF